MSRALPTVISSRFFMDRRKSALFSKGYGYMPNVVLFDKDLPSTAKLLFVLISSLSAERGYCFAKNEYLAEKMGISETMVSLHIKSLEKYLIIENGTSINRQIFIAEYEENLEENLEENVKEPLNKLKGQPLNKLKGYEATYINNIKSNIVTNVTTEKPVQTSRNLKPVSIEEVILTPTGKPTSKKQYGNGDVSYLIGYMKDKLGLPILDGTEQENRRYCWLTMNKFGGKDKIERINKVKLLIEAASQDTFWATHITSFKMLYYKGVQIISSLRHNKYGVTYL